MIEKQFVEYVVKNLVNNPDAVQVNRIEDDRGVLLELTVDPDDLGRIIGRKGATAQSLRNILRTLGAKNDARYNLKIIETDVQADIDESASHETTTENIESVDTVEKNDTESVENEYNRTDRLRQDIADLRDLDI